MGKKEGLKKKGIYRAAPSLLPSCPTGAAVAHSDCPGVAALRAAHDSPPAATRRDTKNDIHPMEHSILLPAAYPWEINSSALSKRSALNQLASILNQKFWFVYYPFMPSLILNENLPICIYCIFSALLLDISSNCIAICKFKSLFGNRLLLS